MSICIIYDYKDNNCKIMITSLLIYIINIAMNTVYLTKLSIFIINIIHLLYI